MAGERDIPNLPAPREWQSTREELGWNGRLYDAISEMRADIAELQVETDPDATPLPGSLEFVAQTSLHADFRILQFTADPSADAYSVAGAEANFVSRSYRLAYSDARLNSDYYMATADADSEEHLGVVLGQGPFGELTQQETLYFSTNEADDTLAGPALYAPGLVLTLSGYDANVPPLVITAQAITSAPIVSGAIYHNEGDSSGGASSSLYYVDDTGNAHELLYAGYTGISQWADDGLYMYPGDGTAERVVIGVGASNPQTAKLYVTANLDTETSSPALAYVGHFMNTAAAAIGNTVLALEATASVGAGVGGTLDFMESTTTVVGRIQWMHNNTGEASIRVTAGSPWWEFVSSGIGGVVDGAFMPQGNGTQDIGSSSTHGGTGAAHYIRSGYINSIYAASTLGLGVAGTVYWNVNTDALYPNVDDTYDLGTSNRQVNVIYVGDLISTQATAPTGDLTSTTLNDGGGTGAAFSVTAGSTDMCGHFTITAGNGAPGAGLAGKLTFNSTRAAAPKTVLLTSADADGTNNNAYVTTLATTGFNVNFNTALSASEVVEFYYFVVG